MDVSGVDTADLVDQEPGYLPADLQGWAKDGWLRSGRSWNDRGDAPWHRGRADHESEAPTALLMTTFGVTEVDPVDGAPDHQASASLLRSSSARRSASARACDSHTSRSSSRKARRMTSLVRSLGRMAVRMIRSSSSVGRKPMVVATIQRLARRSTRVTHLSSRCHDLCSSWHCLRCSVRRLHTAAAGCFTGRVAGDHWSGLPRAIFVSPGLPRRDVFDVADVAEGGVDRQWRQDDDRAGEPERRS